MLARFIHTRSKRKGLFQAVNCAALPENLLESHLFGHLKGAFTGADRDRTGLVEEARDGTLFLDEIAEVPMAIQAKLLRLLENHEIQPLGARQPRQVDVRFVAATNENLVRAVTAKRFRQDLLFRLKAFDLYVPPLRERREEILPLAHALLARLARDEKLDAPPISRPAWKPGCWSTDGRATYVSSRICCIVRWSFRSKGDHRRRAADQPRWPARGRPGRRRARLRRERRRRGGGW